MAKKPHTLVEWRAATRRVISLLSDDPEAAHGEFDELMKHFLVSCSMLDHADRHLSKNTRRMSSIANILMSVYDENPTLWYA